MSLPNEISLNNGPFMVAFIRQIVCKLFSHYSQIVVFKVSAVEEEVVERGFFCPVTMEGTILVDGVLSR